MVTQLQMSFMASGVFLRSFLVLEKMRGNSHKFMILVIILHGDKALECLTTVCLHRVSHG